MEADESVVVLGQGVKSPWYVGNTCRGLLERFGALRVIDTPVSENAITGAAVGAAIAGDRAVVVHPRMDFMMYALDPIVNEAANWHYMTGGRITVPVVFWGIINRGGEQGAQHSQALHGLFAHVPGLKVVAPSTAYDAKGLMMAAIRDPNPVVFVDDRWLYGEEDHVPEAPYEVSIGRAAIRRPGADVTLVGASYAAARCVKVAADLAADGLDVECIDLRTLKPLDVDTIVASVERTGRLVVVDGGWRSYGVAAEIVASAVERAFASLKSPVVRVTLPDCPAPSSPVLETAYYAFQREIADAVRSVVGVIAARR